MALSWLSWITCQRQRNTKLCYWGCMPGLPSRPLLCAFSASPSCTDLSQAQRDVHCVGSSIIMYPKIPVGHVGARGEIGGSFWEFGAPNHS